MYMEEADVGKSSRGQNTYLIMIKRDWKTSYSEEGRKEES